MNRSRLLAVPQSRLRSHDRFFLFNTVAIVLAIALSAIAASAQAPETPPRSDRDLIHVGDIVDVDVVGSLEFDWRGKLTPEGFLDGLLQVEKQVFALCKTEQELAAAITAEYSRYLRDPEVVVRIVDRTGRPPAIMNGAVRTPARFRIERIARLSELIIAAGGIIDTASGEIEIIRPASSSCSETRTSDGSVVKVAESNVPKTMNIRISELLRGKPGSDPVIRSGDLITVRRAQPVFVVGGVMNPGRIAVRSAITVSRAVASAGGPSRDAELEGVTIYRRRGGRSVITVDLRKIEPGSEGDIVLEPFDVVEVPMKGREKGLFLPTDEELDAAEDEPTELPLRIID